MFVPRTISPRSRGARARTLPSLAEAQAQPPVPRAPPEPVSKLLFTSWASLQPPASNVSDVKPGLVVDRISTSTLDSTEECDASYALGPVMGPVNELTVPQMPSAGVVGISELSILPPQAGSRTIGTITGYRETSRTTGMTLQGAREFRKTHQIDVQGKNIPKPISTFEDCNLPSQMMINLAESGYKQPRPVQMQMMPIALRGSDILVSAETGSGKTAGFLVPTLMHVYGLSQSPAGAMQGPFAIILTPTRELAIQIEDTIKMVVAGLPNMRTALLTGGQAMSSQVYRLKQNIQVVVATPGRLVDIFSRHPEIEFSNVFCLVLDEVDMMFSLGFSKQVKRILDVLPEPPNGRQTIMCSATISKQIQQLIDQYLQKPFRMRVGTPSSSSNVKSSDDGRPTVRIANVFSPSSQIKQTVLWVENEAKKKQLFSLLNDPSYFRPPVMIFVESRVGADLLANAIGTKCPGVTAVSIHGEKSQEERSSAIKSIVDGSAQVIVATGLLARGLNLNVAMVINFDMAPSIQEYVHRVGRANPKVAAKASALIRRGPRLGGMAWAVTFINNDSKGLLSEFANMLNSLDSQRVTPLPPQLMQLVVSRTVEIESKPGISGNQQPPKTPQEGKKQLKRQGGSHVSKHLSKRKVGFGST
ncbi:hypothetical protein EMPS_08917 [Entomortierella parvispora]|uniref:RNA helicase n=1 Tax=Entomortierella parvispora TaxID=205924 RepID=A0A9P3HHA2_9FUNG|nr:hypothetical protein EMPS_08917 [Entomortierella parvispora]